ncbi:MAG: hypothetical protein AABX40_03550 [Candidatus Hydrothermarchaeota archaeon]
MEPTYPEERKVSEMCRRWLEGFNYGGADVEGLELLEQSWIDRHLGLVGVRFSFRLREKHGDGVAFFKAEEVFGGVLCPEMEEGPALLV